MSDDLDPIVEIHLRRMRDPAQDISRTEQLDQIYGELQKQTDRGHAVRFQIRTLPVSLAGQFGILRRGL